MNIDAKDLSPRELYQHMVRLITPRPIAWVSTISYDGIANLAPYSFFAGVGSNPPTVAFCPANRRDGTFKDTLNNVRRTGQFIVNVVTEDVAAAMNLTATETDEDEFVLAELAKVPGACVDVPRVAAASAAMECELHSAITLGTGPGGANMVIGRIVHFYMNDHVVHPDGSINEDYLPTVGRMGGNKYTKTRDQFEIKRPS